MKINLDTERFSIDTMIALWVTLTERVQVEGEEFKKWSDRSDNIELTEDALDCMRDSLGLLAHERDELDTYLHENHRAAMDKWKEEHDGIT